MKVFIRKIPRTSTPYLLKRFVESAMSRRWYSPFGIKGTIKSCVILRIKDPTTREVDYYGLLDIHPVKAAQAVIQKLNMKRFEGHLVEVRKWHVRSALADRRTQFGKGKEISHEDRRFEERRRPNIVIDTHVPIQTVGVKGFHRQHRD